MVMTIFYLTFFADILLFGGLYLAGYLSNEKEFKDVWNGEKTMEIHKSQRLHNQWEKYHPVLHWFQEFYFEPRRLIKKPEELFDNLKYFIQRGKKGFSRKDIWGFDWYLSNILVDGLKELKEIAHASPCGMQNVQSISLEEDDNSDLKLWKEKLSKMILTFETTQKIQERDWIPVFDEKERKNLRNYVRRLNHKTKKKDLLFPEIPETKYHLMTKKEMNQYNEGWDLFKQYYFDLWD